MPSARISLVAAVLAGVLALAAASGSLLMAGGIAIVQIVFALGVVRSAGIPSARVAAWLGLGIGLATLAWVESAGTPGLTPVAAVLGPTMLVAFVVQLVRRDGRAGLNQSLALVVAACVLTVLPVMWLALRATGDGVHTVGLALLGVGSVGVTEALPISRAVRRVLGVILASVGAAVLVVVVEPVGEAVPAVSAVVISAFAAVMAAVAFAAADRLADDASPIEEPVLVTVPDDTPSAALGADGQEPEPTRKARAAGAPGRHAAAIVPLRVTGPFVAAAPTAYVLGQLLVR